MDRTGGVNTTPLEEVATYQLRSGDVLVGRTWMGPYRHEVVELRGVNWGYRLTVLDEGTERTWSVPTWQTWTREA